MIAGIELDPDTKPDFCEPCAKPSPIGSHFRRRVRLALPNMVNDYTGNLWGPATVKSLAGNSYVAARLDDATRETKLTSRRQKVRP